MNALAQWALRRVESHSDPGSNTQPSNWKADTELVPGNLEYKLPHLTFPNNIPRSDTDTVIIRETNFLT